MVNQLRLLSLTNWRLHHYSLLPTRADHPDRRVPGFISHFSCLNIRMFNAHSGASMEEEQAIMEEGRWSMPWSMKWVLFPFDIRYCVHWRKCKVLIYWHSGYWHSGRVTTIHVYLHWLEWYFHSWPHLLQPTRTSFLWVFRLPSGMLMHYLLSRNQIPSMVLLHITNCAFSSFPQPSARSVGARYAAWDADL